ncbi:PREDICTED: IST1 homolog [Amphimedon queenslandica]|uniref:IST1 homolog n=1 Tax=Amphimedon queenslandica TaxID=400682 RepID=A0A1X7VEA3_AMPQE|nr:PREDICTED: IST1 homolog [Amphimedon queenslandica]|eukprot:XP_003384586.1 PREDICTED: IST1 homolog [Amphimedon queenslandica]
MPAFKEQKLKANLRLCINRLKLLEKKKTEQALKARKEIADYIKGGRLERAKIRVEHIIREDYLVEAFEIIELYCDLLLARMGMLITMKYCEESLIEAVQTLIWVSPRLCADVQELGVVEHQLEIKFGKEFATQARSNAAQVVNKKVVHRLGVEAPSKALVENYMVEIAKNYKVEYQPDPTAFIDPAEFSADPDEKPYMPGGDDDGYGGGGGGESLYTRDPTAPQPMIHPGSAFPPQATPFPPQATPFPPQAGPLPQKGFPPGPGIPPGGYSQPAPPYTETALPYPVAGTQLPGQQPPALPPTGGPLPPPNGGLDLPPVPTEGFSSTTGSEGGGDVDFDDLTRRFEELKRRK